VEKRREEEREANPNNNNFMQVNIEYEALPAILSIEEAIQHNSFFTTRNLSKGDVDAALKACEEGGVVLNGEFFIAGMRKRKREGGGKARRREGEGTEGKNSYWVRKKRSEGGMRDPKVTNFRAEPWLHRASMCHRYSPRRQDGTAPLSTSLLFLSLLSSPSVSSILTALSSFK
jgi:hypothetical protein